MKSNDLSDFKYINVQGKILSSFSLDALRSHYSEDVVTCYAKVNKSEIGNFMPFAT